MSSRVRCDAWSWAWPITSMEAAQMRGQLSMHRGHSPYPPRHQEVPVASLEDVLEPTVSATSDSMDSVPSPKSNPSRPASRSDAAVRSTFHDHRLIERIAAFACVGRKRHPMFAGGQSTSGLPISHS